MLQRRAFEHTAAVRVGGGERILVAAADGFGGFPVSAQRFRAGRSQLRHEDRHGFLAWREGDARNA